MSLMSKARKAGRTLQLQMMRRFSLCLLFLPVVAEFTARAAELPEVVVTATRTPEDRLDVPASVSVVDATQIENSPARNIDDLLRGLGGVYVLRSVGMGYGLPSQVNIRGVQGQNAILMLADDIPLNEPLTGFAGLNEIPLDSVGRVEVVRGPFSALYGADAFAGVVNVISAPPEDLPAARFSARTGNEGYRGFTGTGSAGTRDLGYTVTIESRAIDNYLGRDRVIERLTDPATGQSFDTWREARNYDYDDLRGSATFRALLDEDTRLAIHARHYEGDLGYGVVDVRPLFPEIVDSDMETASSALGATLQSEIGPRLTARARAYVRSQDRKLSGLDIVGSGVAGNPVFAESRSDTDGRDWFVEAGSDIEIGNRHDFSAGVDYLLNSADFSPLRFADTGARFPSSTGRSADIYNVGAYLQDQIALPRELRLIAGARFDEHSEFGAAISPRAGIIRNLSPATTLRASAGRAYRAPSLTELFQPDVYFGSVLFRSNPDLDPEYIISTDLGLEHRFAESLTAGLNLFYNDRDDLITKTVSGSTLSYANTDEAWSAGVEAGVEWRMAPGLKAYANYTGQRTENRETKRDLEHMAEHMLSAGLMLSRSFREWTLGASTDAHYIGKRGYVDFATGLWEELDEYIRLDAALRCSYRNLVWAGFTIENAADETYREWPLIQPAPGRLYAFEIGMNYW